MPSTVCMICNKEIKIQIFMGTDVCSEDCRKKRDNDFGPVNIAEALKDKKE